MKIRLVAAASGALAALAAAAQGQVVINEFVFDDLGTDSAEFVELYNAGSTPVDISGWKVSRGSTSNAGSYTAPVGTSIAAGGYMLIGSGSSGSLPVDGSIAGNLANSAAHITLTNASGTVIDSVVYAMSPRTVSYLAGVGEPPYDGTSPTSGGGIWATHVTVESGGFQTIGNPNASLTLQRSPNLLHLDSNNNELDFFLSVASPKAPNFSAGTVVTPAAVNAGLTFDFEGADGTAEVRLPGNFSSVTCQNPTVADAVTNAASVGNGSPNPNSIPAAPAPGGGNAGMTWAATTTASSGYGNAAVLNLSEPMADIEAEALVYIPASLSGAQYEMGSYFVLRGRPDGFHIYNDDDPGTTPEFPNGDVGVRVRFENNVSGSGQVNLFVEQKVDGVSTPYGSPINIPSGSAGWHRILLSVKGSSVAAIIGGTYGTNTANGTLAGGIRVDGTTTILRPGGVGMNYHTKVVSGGESLTAVRPLTYDHLTFRAPTLAGAAGVEGYELY